MDLRIYSTTRVRVLEGFRSRTHSHRGLGRKRVSAGSLSGRESRINEREMRSVADAMVSNGLVAAGYTVSHLPSQWLPDVAINSLLPLNLCPPRQYLNIDDLWAADQRNAQGEITEDLIKFPSGMPALAKYLKSRGMHLGL